MYGRETTSKSSKLNNIFKPFNAYSHYPSLLNYHSLNSGVNIYLNNQIQQEHPLSSELQLQSKVKDEHKQENNINNIEKSHICSEITNISKIKQIRRNNKKKHLKQNNKKISCKVRFRLRKKNKIESNDDKLKGTTISRVVLRKKRKSNEVLLGI